MNRRTASAAFALLGATWGSSALAQTPLGRVGVFSFLGDSVQTEWPEDKPGATRVDARGKASLDFKGIGFDLIALRASRHAIASALPAARVELYKSPKEMPPQEQRSVAEGARRAELPDWMVKTLEADKLTHLLLITRHRGSIDAQTGDGNAIGRGTVEGIGFYLDTLYAMLNPKTGAVSTGLLAPYICIRLTLMDAQSGDVVNTHDLRESFAYAPEDIKTQADPWNFMPANEKVRVLRGMVEAGVSRGTQELLKKQ